MGSGSGSSPYRPRRPRLSSRPPGEIYCRRRPEGLEHFLSADRDPDASIAEVSEGELIAWRDSPETIPNESLKLLEARAQVSMASEIRKAHRAGASLRKIALASGISHEQVRRIIAGQTRVGEGERDA